MSGALADPRDRAFVAVQKSYWKDVDVAHFHWQTQGAYISATEAELLAPVVLNPGERFLEIGCGEGANLRHLRGRSSGTRMFAVDFSQPKVRFAREATGALMARADGARLPFRSSSFDAVLVRDLLHHVPDRSAVLAEAIRVLKPGGRITVIEPNGRNPIVAAMALAIGAERGMLASTVDRVTAELRSAGADGLMVAQQQPLPMSRVVLHYRFGVPSLGGNRIVAALLRSLERAASILPRSTWAYFTVRGIAPAPPDHSE